MDRAAAIAALDADLVRLFGSGLYDEQRECLNDPARRDEALDMLDDMQERMGVDADVIRAVSAAL